MAEPVLPGRYWVVVHREDHTPVVPLDCNEDHDDEGMLVYNTFVAADRSANHQMALYDVDAIAIPLGEEK